MTQKEEHINKIIPKVKKTWEKPFLDCLDITKTMKDIDWDEEGTLWFWTYGS